MYRIQNAGDRSQNVKIFNWCAPFSSLSRSNLFNNKFRASVSVRAKKDRVNILGVGANSFSVEKDKKEGGLRPQLKSTDHSAYILF